jgi:hypothetical protein
MKWRVCTNLALLALIWIVCGNPAAYGQKEYHGADSVFRAEGIGVIWAVLKGSDDASSQVYIKIIGSGDALNRFQTFSIMAIDPFSNTSEWVVNGEKLRRDNLITSSRAAFRDKPLRKILFFKNIDRRKKGKPDLVIYYMSIPDTAPEFLTEKQLEDYFSKAADRL